MARPVLNPDMATPSNKPRTTFDLRAATSDDTVRRGEQHVLSLTRGPGACVHVLDAAELRELAGQLTAYLRQVGA